MNEVQFLVLLLGIWLFAQYIIGPIAVRFTLTVPETYVLPRLDYSELLASNTQARGLHDELSRLGFLQGGATRLPNVGAVLYANPGDGSSASLQITKGFVAVAFSQPFQGRYLSLSNAPLPSVYPRWNKKISYILPSCHKVDELWDIYKLIRARLCVPSARAEPAAGISMTEAFLNEELAHLIETGIFSDRVKNGKHRVTLKGAFVMTWKLAWPSKSILLFIESRRARAAAA